MLKRGVLVVLVRVYEALGPGEAVSILEVAERTDAGWRTAKRCLHALRSLGLACPVVPEKGIREKWSRV